MVNTDALMSWSEANIISELKQAHAIFYKPFVQLEGASGSEAPIRLAKLAEIQQLIYQRRWDDARQRSAELINFSLEGLRYLQT